MIVPTTIITILGPPHEYWNYSKRQFGRARRNGNNNNKEASKFEVAVGNKSATKASRRTLATRGSVLREEGKAEPSCASAKGIDLTRR